MTYAYRWMWRSGQISSVWGLCVLLVNILLCSSIEAASSPGISRECQYYLTYVAQGSSRFEVCALLNARPFTVCTDCFNEYSFAHNTIVNLKNGRGPVEKNCSEDLLSGDRVSIINRAFLYLTETWQSGSCDSCFVMTKKNDEVSFKLAESTKEFMRRATKVSECIDSHLRNHTQVCAKCQASLGYLSDLYNELAKKYEGRLCMDIIDLMNTTRVEWAEYGCAHVYGLDLEVWLYAGVMVTITIVFYFAARFSQKPRDAEILQGRTMREHLSRLSVGSSTARDQEELIDPSQSQRPLFVTS